MDSIKISPAIYTFDVRASQSDRGPAKQPPSHAKRKKIILLSHGMSYYSSKTDRDPKSVEFRLFIAFKCSPQ